MLDYAFAVSVGLALGYVAIDIIAARWYAKFIKGQTSGKPPVAYDIMEFLAYAAIGNPNYIPLRKMINEETDS